VRRGFDLFEATTEGTNRGKALTRVWACFGALPFFFSPGEGLKGRAD
jgi:hypothetical protein